jgi:hypothetical protein
MERRLSVFVTVPRLLAALALAAALVAIPAARPEDADAMRISERKVVHNCIRMGGEIHYDFWGDEEGGVEVFDVTCTLDGGQSFFCWGFAGETAVECYF